MYGTVYCTVMGTPYVPKVLYCTVLRDVTKTWTTPFHVRMSKTLLDLHIENSYSLYCIYTVYTVQVYILYSTIPETSILSAQYSIFGVNSESTVLYFE